MQRVVIRKPGGYSALEAVEQPDPAPGPGEVVIAVEAAGVNYADGIIRMGLYESAKRLHGYPITPGFEVAGRIAATGAGVDGWKTGDPAIGLTLFNGYASHLRLGVDGVFPIPRGLGMAEAATLPTVFLTAWWMIHRQLHPDPGETWLVHSAAGGVGSAILQLGRLAGARSIAVVGGTHKVEHARRMGAVEVVDKSAEPLWRRARELAPDGYDAIFDANGVATLADSYAHLAPTGRLLVYGFHSMLPRNGRLNWPRLALDWLRTPRFKYTRYVEGDGEELYDMIADPGETRTLVDNPAHAAALDEHRALLQAHLEATGDDFIDLSWLADARWRTHRPGYQYHTGPAAPMV